MIKMKVDVKFADVQVDVDEVSVIEDMIYAIERGARTVYYGKFAKSGKPVLFAMRDDRYDEHTVHTAVLASDKDEIDKFFHLFALYRLMTGKDYCTIAPASQSCVKSSEIV